MDKRILRNISIIVAIARNNAIGKENRLLWHLSDDLKRFKKLTSGHTLIMGRNTFLSLPNGALPNRRHIVITDVPNESFEADTFFPEIEFGQWKALTTEAVDSGEKNEYPHTYTEYIRN